MRRDRYRAALEPDDIHDHRHQGRRPTACALEPDTHTRVDRSIRTHRRGDRWLRSSSRRCDLAAAQRAPKATVAGAERPIATASPKPARSCLDTAATIVPARLDDQHLIYVEQETVVANRDGRVLVAGAPVYVWRQRGRPVRPARSRLAVRHDHRAVVELRAGRSVAAAWTRPQGNARRRAARWMVARHLRRSLLGAEAEASERDRDVGRRDGRVELARGGKASGGLRYARPAPLLRAGHARRAGPARGDRTSRLAATRRALLARRRSLDCTRV